MAEITTAMVKQLRELTGAGVLACKNALVENDGDIDKAVDSLRERGEAQAVKKAGRIAAEGIVEAVVKDNKAVIVEVNSETDFVAKNEKFRVFVDEVVQQIFVTAAADVEELLEDKWLADESKTVREAVVSMVATIGENISIRRFEKIETEGMIVSYVHGGGRIGVLVEAASVVDGAEEALKNVAMQIAALSPRYISEADVDPEFLAHEKEILTAQAKNDPANAKKPENIIEKMVIGRINKGMKEICLMEQPYVKDDSMSVGRYLKSAGDIVVKRFIRFETGEGIEKKRENFAEEVAKQIG
ncbi:MAG: translation elongation factor Ts [Lachnospiraceae bacterium]|jgi:elongation factor Ts